MKGIYFIPNIGNVIVCLLIVTHLKELQPSSLKFYANLIKDPRRWITYKEITASENIDTAQKSILEPTSTTKTVVSDV